MRPIIMLEYEALVATGKSELLEFLSSAQISFILVGSGLQHKENYCKLADASDNFALRFFKPLCATNSFKLRKSFVKYFSEQRGYDFERMACVTAKKEDVKNNIVVNKNIIQRIMKFYGITAIKDECRNCQGSGTVESYDPCGCVERESRCQNCSGRGYHHKLKYND